ncbi:MAG: hypothetical protein HYZ29_07270 [Myxococcales bacterium]|nr:hypothetical protein [Myxococcales bacterium]
MAALIVESAADEGLLGLVTRAEHAIIDQTTDPVGVVHIEAIEPTEAHPHAALEAAFVERGGSGVVERLEVHLELATAPTRESLARLIGSAGGVDYTSVCLRDDERELLDVTLHFGSVIKLFGRCTALCAEGLTPGQLGACEHVLSALRIASARREGQLSVPPRRFGARPTVADQVEALWRGRERGLWVELYASTLPMARSVRVALSGSRMLCTVSRQIPESATSIAKDAVALREIAARDLGFEIGVRRWRVENAHGERDEHRPHGPMGGQRVQWSLNWGAKRG